MYSPDIVEKGYNGKRAIVVSVNRCFDTIVDDNLSYYLLGLSYFDEHWNNSSIKTWKR